MNCESTNKYRSKAEVLRGLNTNPSAPENASNSGKWILKEHGCPWLSSHQWSGSAIWLAEPILSFLLPYDFANNYCSTDAIACLPRNHPTGRDSFPAIQIHVHSLGWLFHRKWKIHVGRTLSGVGKSRSWSISDHGEFQQRQIRAI